MERLTQCPKCKSVKFVKDGIVKSKQRFKCKSCNYRFSVARRGKPLSYKRRALQLYLEGMSYRRISRALHVSNVTVRNWVSPYADNLAELRGKGNNIKTMEIQPMLKEVLRKSVSFERDGLFLISLRNNPDHSFISR